MHFVSLEVFLTSRGSPSTSVVDPRSDQRLPPRLPAKTKQTYLTPDATGGRITLFLLILAGLLSLSPLSTYFSPTTTHQFAIEKSVGHTLQINLDIVVAMRCNQVHINVQDATGDRLMAGTVLSQDPTSWAAHLSALSGREDAGDHLDDSSSSSSDASTTPNIGESIQEVLRLSRRGRRFPRTPRLRSGVDPDACRIYGSMEVNKVQGDFHITARGHGYLDFGAHIDHSAFNFSHLVSHLSFGPHYPALHSPLDNHVESTPTHFHRYQYFLSLVPTIYIGTGAAGSISRTVRTNQYAVTRASDDVGERYNPGIFFKFDIEPILLVEKQGRSLGPLETAVRVVNVISGVLVGGGWAYGIAGVLRDAIGKRGWAKGQGRGGSGQDGLMGGM